MTRFIVRRLVAAVAMSIVLTAVVFGLGAISRTNLAETFLGHADASAIAHERHILGLDKPLAVQYYDFLGQLVHGNLGVSAVTHRPVTTDLSQFLPPSIELVVLSMLLAIFLGAVLGIASAVEWPGANVFRLIIIAGASVPSFLLAIGAVIVFYHYLGWLPASGQTSLLNPPSGPTGMLLLDGLLHGSPTVMWDAFRHLILPCICLALAPAMAIGRVLRGSLADNMNEAYIQTARAKGQSQLKVVMRHGLRNSANAAIQMTGLQVGFLFASLAVVEEVFAWPGIGTYTGQAITLLDRSALAALALLFGLVYILANALVDVVQAICDPRLVIS